jgi:hypothetical protein
MQTLPRSASPDLFARSAYRAAKPAILEDVFLETGTLEAGILHAMQSR